MDNINEGRFVLMKIHRLISELHLDASACALGMFDGIHVGHVMVLENALREARFREIPSVVVSFADHPQILTTQTPTAMLSSLEERLERFENLGFDYAFIPTFDEHLKNLPAEAFVTAILQDQLGSRSVTVGYDHRFGKDRRGDGALLKSTGLLRGFDVHIIDPVRTLPDSGEKAENGGQIVSSTLIRKLLSYGDLAQANRLLGYDYAVSGPVEHGMQRGRQLGFPTANLALEARRLAPANGVYAGWAQFVPNATTKPQVLESQFAQTGWPAVYNVGISPTFGDQVQKRVEVHLLGYEGPVFYGETLRMTFQHKIRDERKFDSLVALTAQIEQDCHQARTLLTPEPSVAFCPELGSLLSR
jgi:riboflavin kinase / FMN adenylyltransferase